MHYFYSPSLGRTSLLPYPLSFFPLSTQSSQYSCQLPLKYFAMHRTKSQLSYDFHLELKRKTEKYSAAVSEVIEMQLAKSMTDHFSECK